MASPNIPQAPAYGSKNFQATGIWPTVYTTATNVGVDPYSYYSLISTEGVPTSSGWAQGTPVGTSGQRAQGPAQVLPTTAASLGLPSSADPNSPSFIADNLTAGAKVWKQALSASNGDIANAAFAYKGATSASGRESVNSAVQTVIQQVGMTSSPTMTLARMRITHCFPMLWRVKGYPVSRHGFRTQVLSRVTPVFAKKCSRSHSKYILRTLPCQTKGGRGNRLYCS